MNTVEIVLRAVSFLLWVFIFWNLYRIYKIASRVCDERDEAMDEVEHWKGKYADIVTLTFMLKQSYAEQCDIEETQETALMKHAAICELLFRAGLAGTGGKRDDGEN